MSPSISLRAPSVLRRLYALTAPVYARLTAPLSSRARRAGLAHLAPTDGERILEVGTGPGRAFHQLLRANPSGWTDGLDATPAMLRRARRRAARVPHGRYRLRRGVASALPYASDRYDAIFSAYLVDLLPPATIPAALAEMRRVLRPGGRLVLVTLAPPRRRAGRAWAQALRVVPLLLGGSRPLPIRPRLRRAGFRVQQRAVRREAGLPSAITVAVACPEGPSPPSN